MIDPLQPNKPLGATISVSDFSFCREIDISRYMKYIELLG